MLIHYVDDSWADVVALKRALRDERAVSIQSTERIDQIICGENHERADIFVLDIFRPDSVSIELDVHAIRCFTDAPIVFLTGQDPERFRARAVGAGALDVLHKSNIDGSSLMRLFEQVCKEPARQVEHDDADDVLDGPADMLPIWPMIEPTVASCDEALAFIEQVLDQSVFEQDSADNAKKVASLLFLMRRIGARNFSTAVLADAADILQQTFDALAPTLWSNGVRMIMDVRGKVPFWSVGSRCDADLGLTALVEGLVALCGRNDQITFTVKYDETGPCIAVVSSKALISHKGEIFRATCLHLQRPTYGLAMLQCAIHLLGIRPEQVTLNHGKLNEIVFHL